MQTFLPFKSFIQTAQCLSRQHLGKQRVEVLQILNTLTGKSNGWSNHPAVKMWRGYEASLCHYGIMICDEWIRRGYKDTCRTKLREIENEINPTLQVTNTPMWLQDEFCLSHQSNLVRKNPDHYCKYFPDVPDNLPYIWPA